MQCFHVLIKPSLLYISKRTIANVVTVFRKSAIVPDVLPMAPEEVLEIDFNYKSLKFGSSVPPSFASNEPTTVKWNFVDQREKYTLCMINPDSPCRANPLNKEYLHWLVTNIPGDSIEKGNTIAEYVGVPNEGITGVQRYIFLVFMQGGHIDTSKFSYIGKYETDGRSCFSTLGFQRRYHLSAPIAGNFFYTCVNPLAVRFSNIRERTHKPGQDKTLPIWVDLTPASEVKE